VLRIGGSEQGKTDGLGLAVARRESAKKTRNGQHSPSLMIIRNYRGWALAEIPNKAKINPPRPEWLVSDD
jgi:hypothetical protein